uniref:DDT domain-containing protein n=1 Tax=Ditylenchus dipsaci TaxID=166011 RepID=A0A915CU87_9BILA
MPKKGKPVKQQAQNNTISVTPRTRNGRKSAASKWTAAGKSPSLRHVKPSGSVTKRVTTSQTKDKKLKPWEDSDEEADQYRPFSAHLSNSDMETDMEDEEVDKDKDEEMANGISEASSDEVDASSADEPVSSEAIFCPWKELPADRIPELILPCSSSDLLVDKDHLFDTLEIYEILRVYHRVIQISPFLFEDFCCAMRSPTQLLCEIHIAFIRLLFREDEDEQTTYSVQDTGNSFNIMLQLLEPMTFAEILRHGNWLCQVCELHQVKGVTDCALPGQLKRIQSLGYDRHGRLYWFVARRLFVQDVEHSEVLLLFPSSNLRTLANRIPLMAEHMRLTLELTDERRINLQKKTQRESPQPYIHVDNIHRMSKIVADLVLYGEENNHNKMEVDGHATNEECTKLLKKLLYIDDGHLTDSFWTGGHNETQLIEYHNRLENEYALINSNGKTDGVSLIEDLQLQNQRGYRLGFSDGEYREYVNQFSVNDFAKSPYLRAKERDRRKYMCSRFSLMDEGEFSWVNPKGKTCFGSEADVSRSIQLSLRKLTEKIPDQLMHRLWNMATKEKFIQELQQSTDADALKMVLLQYEKAVRKPVFSSIWWNSLGHTKLIRTTAEDREKRQKLEVMKKKEERSLMIADPEETDIVWVKYSRPPKHNIWRLKDEQFRVNGRDSLGGWMWVSSTLTRKFVDLPKKPPLKLYTATREQLNTREARKAQRLDKLVKKLATWRAINIHTNASRKESSGCYSPSCRMMPSIKTDQTGKPIALLASTSVNNQFLSCYSPTCPRRNMVTLTTEISKAYKPFRRNPYDPSTHQLKRNPDLVAGEGIPFPLQKPFEYKSKSGKRSILILPQRSLHKFARQGGLKSVVMIPGFHRVAKSNMSVWNYPCPRPLFDNCWRFLTLNASSLHAVALQFRIMYSCIRWSDLEPDEDDPDPRVWGHFPDYDEVRTVLDTEKIHQMAIRSNTNCAWTSTPWMMLAIQGLPKTILKTLSTVLLPALVAQPGPRVAKRIRRTNMHSSEVVA